MLERVSQEAQALTEKLVQVNRVSKVVKGGRRFHFNALVVVGDGQGRVGVGLGKANEVPEAIRKGGVIARKALIQVPLTGGTIPHGIIAKFSTARIMLKPARPGTGVIAGSGVRATLEVAGVKDVVTKALSGSNAINLVRATILALSQLKDPEAVMERRGKVLSRGAKVAAQGETA